MGVVGVYGRVNDADLGLDPESHDFYRWAVPVRLWPHWELIAYIKMLKGLAWFSGWAQSYILNGVSCNDVRIGNTIRKDIEIHL